ncbi:MAG TPA: hypothetical protein VGN60_07515 [Devosia sp.]|jgi:hypothetical protein|nr:hypothetical protein [Devosia sp.]
MVRILDAATQGAVRDRSRIIPRDFIVCTVLTFDGDEVTFGFTNFGDDVITNVIDGANGATVSHTFYGDNAPLTSMDPIPMHIGVEVDTTEVVLNHLHPVVEEMIRGHNCRNARVQIHRGYLDPASMLLVAAPRCRRLGQINGTPIVTPAVGGQGSVTLKIVSHTRELTRTNPVKSSDETYRLRDGDRINQYAGTAGQWPIFWGEAKS